MGDCDSASKYYPNVVLLTKKLYLDTSLADLTLRVGGDSVMAHAGVVACRCEELLPSVQDEKSKKRKKHEVKLKDGTVKSAPILHKVLEFVYTGGIDFAKLSIEDFLYVNQAARNLHLVRLVYICEKWLKDELKMDNVYHYLKAASDLKEEKAKSICMTFALEHYVEFISNKNDIQIIGIDLFQEVVAAFNPAAKKASEEQNDSIPKDTLIQDFKNLYNTMMYSDSQITLGETQIKYHRYLLIAHSELFHNFNLEHTSVKAFNSMLKFLYYADDKIDVISACELVDISRKFKLHTLCRIVEEIALNNVSNKSCLQVLQIAYLPYEGKVELANEIKARTLPFIIDNIHHVDLSNLANYDPMMACDIVHQYQFSIKESSKGGSNSRRKSSGISSSRSSSILDKESQKNLVTSIPIPEKSEDIHMPMSAKLPPRKKSNSSSDANVIKTKKKKEKHGESEHKKKK